MNRLRKMFRLPQSPRRRALLFGGVVVGFIALLLIIPPVWEYSNSPDFCGSTCHTMPPEYNTYRVSPHARVLCVDCHIGRGLLIEQFVRKTSHMRLLFDTITGHYEYPIMVSSMRPARETCELCHFPEKFSDDSLRVLNHFSESERNERYDVYLLMHTGGGSQREGLGRGIHWHVENAIEFIATDTLQQDIPWIRVNTADGQTIEYVAENATIDTQNLDQYTLQTMDCITCHNRISHLLDNPRNLVDSLLLRGQISTDIPFIRARAVDLLTRANASVEDPEPLFAELEAYYRIQFPTFYAENEGQVGDAITALRETYAQNTYPAQELDWQTHPNNVGHRDWPGCFRCHDGQHFSAEGEAVRLECNLCHSIPVVVRPGDIEPTLLLATGIEPESHLDSTWISRHHNEFDQTCANCHTVNNPGGTDDSSFCSNSMCHGVDWRFGGFDAPTLAIQLGLQEAPPAEEATMPEEGPAAPPAETTGQALTYQTLQPLFESRCGGCHGDNPTRGLRVTDYDSLMAGSSSGPVIVAGSPDESRIVQVLSEGHFARFSDEELDTLRQWIAAGAPVGEAAPPPALTYQTLQPILQDACGRCHGPTTASRGLNITTYDALMAGSTSGPVIVPEAPERSRIVEILGQGHFARLTDDQMDLLRAWIQAGAPAGESTPAQIDEG